jgi:hypothetical protein
MTELICRILGIVCFVFFVSYGLVGTRKLVASTTLPLGPRPWALFAVFTLLEAVQVYGLIAAPASRPPADIRAGDVVAVAALFFCGYLQRLYFVSAHNNSAFPRAPFYGAVAVLLAVVVAAHFAAPALP